MAGGSCRGICTRYAMTRRGQKKYEIGLRFCRYCRIWFSCDDRLCCICCGKRLRCKRQGSKLKSRSVQHLNSINVQDEYGTPKELFQNICKKYDIYPQIDICATKANHVLSEYITKEQNRFTHSITQDFFMNPPYSRVSEFMEFAYEQHLKNNISCIFLTYSKTGTRWWHKYVQGIADHVDFQKGQIRFSDEKGYPTKHCAP